MKVTIIGGSGFIGTRIVDHFTQFKGYDLHIVDIRDSHFFNDITTIGDVRNQQQMDSALTGTDLVILLAAQHRDNVTPTSLYYDTNVGGMRTTLHAMERNGVKRILFFSSVAVYGINKDNPKPRRKTRSTTTANRNGRRSNFCRNGTRCTPTGTSTWCAPP